MKKNRLLRVAVFLLPLLITSLWSYGQSVKVTGTVSETSGSPIPGVNVKVVGTTIGTITTLEGTYQIDVPANGSLEFSSMGFTSQIIAIGNQTVVNVTLESDATVTDEVVVVGYGTQRKEAVTGSVASMKGDEMRDVPSSNITQALQGRVAGVDMEQTSTKPGAQMQIRIRGTRSLNASNDPLVVLDGIPFAGQIGDINPSSIKSVDILKDASATAIYGSRGANGVILITTNKGSKGQKAQISYTGYYGVKNVFSPFPMMEGPEFIKLRAAANQFTNALDESDDVNTNWQDLFYRKGMTTNHDVSVSGGTEHGNYNFSVGYYKDEAVIPTQDFSRISLRGSLDQEVGKYFRFGFSTNNNYSINNGNNIGMSGVLSMSPLANPYNADGTWKRTVKMPLDENWVQTKETIEKLGD
jgi:TonB-dependent starch-binding outer membrane protein SusC